MLQQPLARHFTYMENLQEDGVLCLGGPFKDNTGAMGIILAADFKSASAIITNDPAVLDGIFAAEVYSWHPAVPGVVEAKAWT